MKSILFILLLLPTAFASAASPFTWSGAAIETIFSSPIIWKKIHGEIESIVFKGHGEKTSKYELTTTERIAIIDKNGITTGYTPLLCKFTVTVSFVGDALAPTLEVTDVDFSLCQKN